MQERVSDVQLNQNTPDLVKFSIVVFARLMHNIKLEGNNVFSIHFSNFG